MAAGAMDWGRGLFRRIVSAATGSQARTGGGRHSGEPVEVFRAANELEAHVIKGFLESNEIPAMLRRDSMGPTLGVSIGPLAEVSVLVPAALAPRALDLLEAQAEAGRDTGDAD